MKHAEIGRKRLFAVKLEPGDEVISSLTRFCQEKKIHSGIILGIGALKEAEFITGASTKRLHPKTETLKGPVEIACATGNVSLKEGKPFVHLHASASLLGDSEKGGAKEVRTINSHLARGIVSLTGEFFILECGPLSRGMDERIEMFTWKI